MRYQPSIFVTTFTFCKSGRDFNNTSENFTLRNAQKNKRMLERRQLHPHFTGWPLPIMKRMHTARPACPASCIAHAEVHAERRREGVFLDHAPAATGEQRRTRRHAGSDKNLVKINFRARPQHPRAKKSWRKRGLDRTKVISAAIREDKCGKMRKMMITGACVRARRGRGAACLR
jgi:hypothetical protein